MQPGCSNMEVCSPDKRENFLRSGSRMSPPVTADGAYFIDANPRAFESVLNWLRRGGLTYLPDGFPWGDLPHAAKIIGLKEHIRGTSQPVQFEFLY